MCKDTIQSLNDAACAAGFSEYYFSRLFKNVMDRGFSDFLNEVRLKKAEILLADPDITITEAAHRSGFNSISTFNRVFRSVKGCSPGRFRSLQV